MDDDMYCISIFYALRFHILRNWFNKTKNTINILFKNFFVITMGLLVYCGFGFNLMYPGDFNIIDGVLGFSATAPEIIVAAVAANIPWNRKSVQ